MEQSSINIKYPIIPLDGKIAFPKSAISIELDRKCEIRAFEEAYKRGTRVVLIPQIDPYEESPNRQSFHKTGTVAEITELVRKADSKINVLFIGNEAVDVRSVLEDESKGYLSAICSQKRKYRSTRINKEAYLAEATEFVMTYIEKFRAIHPISGGFIEQVAQINDVAELADFIAGNLIEDYKAKLDVYLEDKPQARLEKALEHLYVFIEALDVRKKIHDKVKQRADRNQKEYYLGEQLKAIREELGEDSDSDSEEYKKRIAEGLMPDDAKERLAKEAGKLYKMPINSAEYNVVCNYLDVCLELPWGIKSEDRIDVALAEKILDRDHYGLERVKERIVEYLAVRSITENVKNQIICLVGPPGTGKTSIARSVAEAMNRSYVRVSLGGVRDEADIRGHRKTYIGSMPGRIIEGIKRAGTTNPVMLLDEIDKLTRDSHGDPASALMEVLDGEQNKEFRDHFIEMPFDLSEVMFIATANTLDTIPRPLLDRMEVIELKSYSPEEKLAIAKKYLIPKQLERHGLSTKTLKINDAAIRTVIDSYTREAGVRNLERQIGTVCRKAAKAVATSGSDTCIRVTARNLEQYLGSVKISPEKISADDEIGVVNGLAYTELGGTLLKVEVAAMPGTGKVECTGSLGDVMKESARTALSYIRSHCDEWNIESDFYSKKDIHIHFPEGAVPKDGPSAGVTMVTAIISELSGKPVRHNVAMTGEVTLKGKVLAIGGLKEKTMAAYNAGVKTVLLPSENMKNLDEVDNTVRENIKFIPCSNVAEVLKNAIVR